MKKRICFAGFGEVELAALKPSLTVVSASWDCVFSPDEGSAFNAMAEAACDVVVVNLSLGGIDSTFLHQASVRHPRTLRFVLGDVADRELIVSCMGAANQFISRPWQAPELITIIERSLALDAWLSNDKLRSFIPRLGKLPGLPATYFEVLKKAESPSSSIESISEVIARDPALTARLLQMVNSPACGLKEKITSPTEAVTRLGLDRVKSLVLCLQLFSETSPVKGASLSLDQLWHHSFTVATMASKIVLNCISSERMASDAYTAGLLHNIGQIVLATNLSKEYSTVVSVARKHKRVLQDVEMELLGVSSNQVGAYLLGLWGLPVPLVEAAALHHSPGSATPVEFSLLTVVHIANVMAYAEDDCDLGLPLPKLDTKYLEVLNLPTKESEWEKLLVDKPSNRPEPEAPMPERPPLPRPSLQRERSEPSRLTGKLLVFATFAIVVVAFLLVKPRVLALLHKVVPNAVAEEPLAPPPSSAATAKDSPFDSIEIKSIIYSTAHPVVLINGTALEVGGTIGGVQVVAIGRTNVLLACNGERKMFVLK